MNMADILVKAVTKKDSFYKWGAKGPDRFDCSGLVTWAIYEASGHIIDWRETHNAERLHAISRLLFDDIIPIPVGALCFYGPPDMVNHIMIYTNDAFNGMVFGASGGNHTTTTDEIAEKQNARVKYKSCIEYRPDFRGYGILTNLLQTQLLNPVS